MTPAIFLLAAIVLIEAAHYARRLGRVLGERRGGGER